MRRKKQESSGPTSEELKHLDLLVQKATEAQAKLAAALGEIEQKYGSDFLSRITVNALTALCERAAAAMEEKSDG